MAQNMVLSGPRGWSYIVLEVFEQDHKFPSDFDRFLTWKRAQISCLGSGCQFLKFLSIGDRVGFS